VTYGMYIGGLRCGVVVPLPSGRRVTFEWAVPVVLLPNEGEVLTNHPDWDVASDEVPDSPVQDTSIPLEDDES